MVAKTKAGTAVAVKQTTAIASWREDVAKDAKDIAASEVTSGRFISTRAGVFGFDGKTLKNPLEVIVLDHVFENTRYVGDFDPDAPASPICFAFGRSEAEMKPHPMAVEPQHPTCKGCQWNQFGTAERGKGKGCKNIRRLAVMLPGQLEDVDNAQVAYMKLPVTSTPPFASYVKGLDASLGLPPYGVITAIKSAPDPKSQYKLDYSVVEKVDLDEHYPAIKAKRAKIAEEIMFPYQPREQAEAAPKSTAKKKYTR